MRRPYVTIALTLWAAALFRVCAGPREDALLSLWTRQGQGQARDAIALCQAAIDSGALGGYAPVARTLLGRHLLRDGRHTEAAAAYAAALSAETDPVSRAADTQARRWLTRLDREMVVAALRRWYAVNVAYPPSLDVLQTMTNAAALPMKDRWGQPWDYELTSFRTLPALKAQRYRLESRTLDRSSSLATVLRTVESTNTPVRLWRVVTQQPPAIEIEVTPPDDKPRRGTLTLGSSVEGIRLAAFNERYALCSDGDNWLLLLLSEAASKRGRP
ncbi:MAG: hypothetical protein PHR35_20755 [Kiritimatiellae bacterium]|nr:hypothetical protein [Kiritimatiellia bacterium]